VKPSPASTGVGALASSTSAAIAGPKIGEGAPPPALALTRLRETLWGGAVWTAAQAVAVLRETDFVDVHALPPPPGSVVTFIVGQRS
jgi:hypothetical protein